MIDVRPIVSFDEGSVNVPTNNSDQMIVMNSLDINSMSSNASTTQSGWVFLKKKYINSIGFLNKNHLKI